MFENMYITMVISVYGTQDIPRTDQRPAVHMSRRIVHVRMAPKRNLRVVLPNTLHNSRLRLLHLPTPIQSQLSAPRFPRPPRCCCCCCCPHPSGGMPPCVRPWNGLAPTETASCSQWYRRQETTGDSADCRQCTMVATSTLRPYDSFRPILLHLFITACA